MSNKEIIKSQSEARLYKLIQERLKNDANK